MASAFSPKSKSNGTRPTHRKTSSNPFTNRVRQKSRKSSVAIGSFAEQDVEGSLIFHELDPSRFPVTKLDHEWMDSARSDSCTICLQKIDSQLFGTKKRHCKKCGRVVCIPCSDIRIRKHRVCEQCHKYYLTLNNILNQWYRTNRNLNHSLCGYDSYTLETCSSLKRILFILNQYHQWLLLRRDGTLSGTHNSSKQQREVRRMSLDNDMQITDLLNTTKRAKVKAPYDITHISMREFVQRLPKYDGEKFLNDIYHLKQSHFKKSEVFKIAQYQKNHKWELRAYSWKKIGKCDRYCCQYGIKDVRRKDIHQTKDQKEQKENHQTQPQPLQQPQPQQQQQQHSMINLDQDIPKLLNNMHVVLLHGVDDDDDEKEKDHQNAKELYDLLPKTPQSPNQLHNTLGGSLGATIFPGMRRATEDFKLDAEHAATTTRKTTEEQVPQQPKLTDAQTLLLAIELRPLSEIEWLDERHQTLAHWLDCCCPRLDFYSTNQFEWEAIQKKKQLLSDILDYLDMTDEVWSDEVMLKSLVKMIKCNLFRALPLTYRQVLATPDYCQEDDSEEYEDAHYPHLCYVYEIALMLVRNINVDDRARKKYLGKTFIVPLTELFASEDVREREYLKAILHGIYARNMRLRRLIRQQMNHCCYRVIYSRSDDDDIENGISECLQLVCSIIQGLTTPIKAEYKNILYSVLIPLHKANSRKIHKFHETLLACCIQFILKDLRIGLDILSGLLLYWPFQSAAKSDMFLKEVVIIVNTMMTDIDTVLQDEEDDQHLSEEERQRKREKNVFKHTPRGQQIAARIIDKLVACMTSDNHCLAEKALLALGEIGVQKLIDLNKQHEWTRILYILFDNRANARHWCRPLADSYQEALDTFKVRDASTVSTMESVWSKKWKDVNQFKKAYDPIYPSERLFTQNTRRMQRYQTLRQMAAENSKKTHTQAQQQQQQQHKNGYEHEHEHHQHTTHKSTRLVSLPSASESATEFV